MILADSSAWIEFDRATGSPTERTLTALIRAGGSELATTEPVMMEVLAGARDDAGHDRLLALQRSFNWLPTDPIADFSGAATIYRKCRAVGFTPRGLIDCMIANIAMRGGNQLLTADRDFAAMASIVPLRLVSIAGTE